MVNPRPGDLMFSFSPGNVISEAIAFKTNAKISHVQCIVDIGVNGTLQTMSAELDGLNPQWVMPETLSWYSILTYDGITDTQRGLICRWMWDHKGIPYDVLGLASFVVNIDLNNEHKVFCSEACYLGYDEGAGIPLLDGIDHAFVSPRDLYIIPRMKTLDGLEKEVR